MKICYINISNYSSVKSGVDYKLEGKCSELSLIFPGSKFVRFATEISGEEKGLFESIKIDLYDKKYFKDFFYKKALFNAIGRFVGVNEHNFDYFILRYPFASISLFKFLKKFPKKVIFEHNTNEQAERKIIVKQNKKRVPFSFSPSVLSYYFNSIFFSNFIERNIGKRCLRYAAAGIVVTPEIADIERKKWREYKTLVLTNAIVPKHFTLAKKESENLINGVFLAGTYAVWHGIERIITSYESSNSTNKIHLYFVGRIDKALINKLSKNVNTSVFLIDYLDRDNLEELLSKMHFAIGTCALHKTGLTEGAVLKVREYLSLGLPVVLGYSDPYIQKVSELNRYCIQFPCNDSKIDFNYIFDEVTKFYNNDADLNSSIQKTANKYLSWERVLKPLPQFLNELSKGIKK